MRISNVDVDEHPLAPHPAAPAAPSCDEAERGAGTYKSLGEALDRVQVPEANPDMPDELGPQLAALLATLREAAGPHSIVALRPSPELEQIAAPPPPAKPVTSEELGLRLPATWYAEPPDDDGDGLSDQLKAGLMGLGAGLLIVVPTVLWMSGLIGGPGKQPMPVDAAALVALAPQPAKVEMAAVKVMPVVAQQAAAVPLLSRAASITVPTAAPAKEVPVDATATPDVDDLVNEASRLIGGGGLTAARALLTGTPLRDTPEVLFALAETFDPNMLAAWGVRGVVADSERASALYTEALSRGMERAKSRLEALR